MKTNLLFSPIIWCLEKFKEHVEPMYGTRVMGDFPAVATLLLGGGGGGGGAKVA